jgi:hypothetical protein
MRAFIISSLIFAAVLGGVIANAVFVADTADRLCALTSEIITDTGSASAVDELERVWQKRHLPLSISVDLDTVERIDELMISLRSAYAEGAHQEIRRLCLIINDTCEELSRYERLSFYALFLLKISV